MELLPLALLLHLLVLQLGLLELPLEGRNLVVEQLLVYLDLRVEIFHLIVKLRVLGLHLTFLDGMLYVSRQLEKLLVLPPVVWLGLVIALA